MNHSVTVAVDPVSIVIRECINLSSVMRKYSKFNSQSGVAALLASGNDLFNKQEEALISSFNTSSMNKINDPFLSGFIQLRLMLNKVTNLDDIDPLTILQPFLLIVSTNTISGFITSLALDSLQKFFNLGIINESSNNFTMAYRELINSLTHCRFERSDQVSDDTVLLKVVMLLNSIIASPYGEYISDSIMYNAIQTLMSLACNKRRTEVLRKAAENSMISITLKICDKLRVIDPSTSKKQYINDENYAMKLKADLIGTNLEESTDSLSITRSDEDADGNQSEEPKLYEVENQDNKSESLNANETEDNKTKDNTSNDSEVPLESESISDDKNTNEESSNEKEDGNLNDEFPQKLENENHDNELEKVLSIIEANSELNYGLPVAKQYLSLLLSVILPENESKHTNSARIFGLQLMTIFIETAGDKIPLHPPLFTLISDPISKCVLYLIQNSSKLSLFQAALQLFSALVVVLGNYLPMQIELTLTRIFTILSEDIPNFIIDDQQNISPDKNDTKKIKKTDTAIKEMLTEQISIFWSRSSSFFTSLFINFDCNLDRADLALTFIRLLTKLALPESATSTTENVPPICLEGLVSLIDDMYSHVEEIPNDQYIKQTSENSILKQRERKTEFITCAKAFNEKPKKGIPLLIEKNFIKSDNNEDIAEFLFENNGRLNKKNIGLLLCDPKQQLLLKAFINLFDFKGLRVDEAIRILLTKFRLPGESQQIERIIEAFSNRYTECQNYECTPGSTDLNAVDENNIDRKDSDDNEKEIKEIEDISEVKPDSDSVFVLSYSIIMLNTDLHNPQVKDHMSFEDYSGNLKGCYNSQDFPHWYLDRIYCSIRDKEIVMPEEHHGNDEWFEDAWNNFIASTTVMTKIQTEDNDIIHKLSPNELIGFDKAIFKHVGASIVNTLFKIFIVASDDHIASRMLTSLDKCAHIAVYFGYQRLYNDILSTIGKLTTISGPNPYTNQDEDSSYSDYEEKIPLIEMDMEGSDAKVPVGNLSLRLGKSLKAQLCVMIYFRILRKTKNSQVISKDTWRDLVNFFLILFENLLLNPDVFTDLQDKLKIDNLQKPPPEVNSKHTENRGLFSTFASYLKGDEIPTEEEIEYSYKAFECVKNSNIRSSIFGNEELITPALINVLLDSINDTKTDENKRYFESELLFLVELIVALLLYCKDEKELGATVINKLSELLQLNGVTKRTIRRLFTYELLLISIFDGQEEKLLALIDQLLTKTDIFNQKFFSTNQGKALITNLIAITKIPNYGQLVLKEESYWRFLRLIASLTEHTELIFRYVKETIDYNLNINSTNDDKIFLFILGLLDEISSIGAIGSRWEDAYNKSIKTGHKVDNENPYQSVVEVSLKSINLTSNLIERKVLNYNEIIAIVQALVHQCLNPCEQIYLYALSILEMTLTEKIQFPMSEEINNLEDLLEDGFLSVINVKPDNQDLVLPIPRILDVMSRIYVYHLKEGVTTNETFIKMLKIFNTFVEIPQVESQLQELILTKKQFENNGSAFDLNTNDNTAPADVVDKPTTDSTTTPPLQINEN